MTRLVLLRHAMPLTSPDVLPEQWELGDEGRSGARELAPALPADAYYAASDEPKAYQTAEEIAALRGGTVVRDARLGEVRRPFVWGEDYRRIRREYVEGADHNGWESRAAVVARFTAAVQDHAAAAAAPLVLASHGMALTVWLVSVLSLPAPGAFWADLRFPDAIAIDLSARTATRLAP